MSGGRNVIFREGNVVNATHELFVDDLRGIVFSLDFLRRCTVSRFLQRFSLHGTHGEEEEDGNAGRRGLLSGEQTVYSILRFEESNDKGVFGNAYISFSPIVKTLIAS